MSSIDKARKITDGLMETILNQLEGIKEFEGQFHVTGMDNVDSFNSKPVNEILYYLENVTTKENDAKNFVKDFMYVRFSYFGGGLLSGVKGWKITFSYGVHFQANSNIAMGTLIGSNFGDFEDHDKKYGMNIYFTDKKSKSLGSSYPMAPECKNDFEYCLYFEKMVKWDEFMGEVIDGKIED